MYLKAKNIDFKYKQSEELVLKNVGFELDRGDTLAILGESGSGKSTILRVLSGLEIAEKGFISIDDKIMNDKDQYVYPEKRGIGMVFQDYALFPHMSIEKNIRFGISNLSKKEQEKRVVEVLELVGLLEMRKREPHELSGGQQQRVALARALAPKPSILLLDEPFSNLDAHLREKIREEMKQIIERSGITSIFVTHDKSDAIAISNKVMIIEKGEITHFGTTQEMLTAM